ncbi:MAG TPA: hypothetical protein IAB09_05980, partial [Candidatus Avilachnospira avicola]|nr:hypothetical protein [Candidatus Avilachnospira avicola]
MRKFRRGLALLMAAVMLLGNMTAAAAIKQDAPDHESVEDIKGSEEERPDTGLSHTATKSDAEPSGEESSEEAEEEIKEDFEEEDKEEIKEDLTSEETGDDTSKEEIGSEDKTEDEDQPAAEEALEDNGVLIEALDEGALYGIDHMSAELLSRDDAMEEAISERLKDGKELVDYAAFDIRLYDEEGNETEPNGAVNVTISGMGSDEDYDEVEIYHVSEVRTLRQRLVPDSLKADPSHGAAASSYHAEKLSGDVSDDTEESGEISFVAEHFSTYVITFIRSASEYTELTVHLKKYEGNAPYADLEYNAEPIDVPFDESEEGISVGKLISGYDMLEILPEDAADDLDYYAFQFATWDEDPSDVITGFKYAELESHNDIYFWYQSIYDLSMEVDVYFDDEPQSGTFSLEAGSFDTDKGYERLQKVIEGITGGTTYSFDRALLVPDGGSGFVIDSASLVGGNIYARRHDTGEIVQYDRNSARVELYYKPGYRIRFHVTGAIENVNTVDGKYQFTNTDPYERQIADGEERTISIKIGQGYHVKISYGNVSYDSSMGSENNTQDNQIRDYALVIADVESDIDVKVEFIKDDITLDYSHYYNDSGTELRDNWHKSDLAIGGTAVSVPTPQQGVKLPALYSVNGGQVSIQVISEVGDHEAGATWILDTFALNRQNVDIPDDHDKSVGETTPILDSAGEKIADASISVSISGIRRTYNIEITNIMAPLKITSFNLMGSTHSEVILDSKADGVTVRSEAATSDGRPVPNPEISKGGLIYGLDGTNTAHLTLDPEFGYYIPEDSLKLTDSSGNTEDVGLDPLNGNPWYGDRTTDLTYGNGVSRLSVGTELVDFVFNYGGVEGDAFDLGIDKSETPAIDASIAPDAPAGEVFIGWKLRGHEDTIYLPDGVTTISKATLMAALSDGLGAVKYQNQGQAVIYLEPYFKNAGIAEDVRYRVTVTIPDLSDETFPKAGHYFGTKGENLTRDIVLQLEEISEYVSQYAAAYQLSSDSSFKLRLENAQKVYDFHLIYIASYADVSVENAADSDHGTITHSGNVVGEVLKFSEGEQVTFGIEPKEGFAIKEININGTPKSPLELGSYTAPHKFIFSYKVLPGENSIIVTYGEDRDGNDVPDDEEVRITFISEHGFNEGTSPYETVQKAGEELKVPVPMDTDSDGVVFTGWEPELPLDKLVPSWKEGGYTFTAVYAADADNDGNPDEDPSTDDPGTDDPGTDTPSTGGGTSSNPTGSGDATPSGPVSVQQSGNSKGYYYTAGLHGNWVHMDNVDMNVPLDEPVPAGATAVDFPEWHRWRFYLSSGVMLDNQWA